MTISLAILGLQKVPKPRVFSSSRLLSIIYSTKASASADLAARGSYQGQQVLKSLSITKFRYRRVGITPLFRVYIPVSYRSFSLYRLTSWIFYPPIITSIIRQSRSQRELLTIAILLVQPRFFNIQYRVRGRREPCIGSICIKLQYIINRVFVQLLFITRRTHGSQTAIMLIFSSIAISKALSVITKL